jgi:hypothetical protein
MGIIISYYYNEYYIRSFNKILNMDPKYDPDVCPIQYTNRERYIYSYTQGIRYY